MCAQHVQAWSLPLLWNLRFNNSTLDMSSNFLLQTFLGQSSFQKCKKPLEILRRVIDWEGSQWRAGKWHVNVVGIHSPLIAHPCDDMPTAWQIGVWKTNHNWAFLYRYNFGSSLMIRYNQFTNKHLVSLFYLHSKSLPIQTLVSKSSRWNHKYWLVIQVHHGSHKTFWSQIYDTAFFSFILKLICTCEFFNKLKLHSMKQLMHFPLF